MTEVIKNETNENVPNDIEFIMGVEPEQENTGPGSTPINKGKGLADAEIQASIWALLLLTSEIALGFRELRNALREKGIFDDADEEGLNVSSGNVNNLEIAYNHIEKAFRVKFDRVMYAMEHPEEMQEKVEEFQREKANAPTTTAAPPTQGEEV